MKMMDKQMILQGDKIYKLETKFEQMYKES